MTRFYLFHHQPQLHFTSLPSSPSIRNPTELINVQRYTRTQKKMSYKSKKRSNDYQSDDFVVDDDSNSRGAKKAKTTASSGAQSSSTQKTDSNGDVYWDISSHRRITISEFKGKSLVSIREYYEKDGQELPGKKVPFPPNPPSPQ